MCSCIWISETGDWISGRNIEKIFLEHHSFLQSCSLLEKYQFPTIEFLAYKIGFFIHHFNICVQTYHFYMLYMSLPLILIIINQSTTPPLPPPPPEATAAATAAAATTEQQHHHHHPIDRSIVVIHHHPSFIIIIIMDWYQSGHKQLPESMLTKVSWHHISLSGHNVLKRQQLAQIWKRAAFQLIVPYVG